MDETRCGLRPVGAALRGGPHSAQRVRPFGNALRGRGALPALRAGTEAGPYDGRDGGRGLQRASRRLLVTTLTELTAIAAPARIGLSRIPKAG